MKTASVFCTVESSISSCEARGVALLATAEKADTMVLAEKIDKALIGFTRARKERRIPVSEGPAKFGVATPQMIVLVFARGAGQVQLLAQYAVGDQAPDHVSRYVMRLGDKEIVTIPNYHIDNLVGLIQAAAAATQQPPPLPGQS